MKLFSSFQKINSKNTDTIQHSTLEDCDYSQKDAPSLINKSVAAIFHKDYL